MDKRVRTENAWVMVHPHYGMNLGSCRWLRREVIAYADTEAAPGWDWKRYRNDGWRVIRVEIRVAEVKPRLTEPLPWARPLPAQKDQAV